MLIITKISNTKVDMLDGSSFTLVIAILKTELMFMLIGLTLENHNFGKVYLIIMLLNSGST